MFPLISNDLYTVFDDDVSNIGIMETEYVSNIIITPANIETIVNAHSNNKLTVGTPITNKSYIATPPFRRSG